MSVALITGSCGLVGSAAVAHFASQGMDVAGIDNDMRAQFFGKEASTFAMKEYLEHNFQNYTHHAIDLRDDAELWRVLRRYGDSISLIIHAAAQPLHDWAGSHPSVDFKINALATSTLLQGALAWAPKACFIFLSTNKVYGDTPNTLPLRQLATRWEIERSHRFADGIDESMPIDQSMHSLFGASKLAADILVQEYGQYYGMRTACFRCGCLTGPDHAGAEQHGFLSYLMRCAMARKPYKIFGYKGKQVRDNLHSSDLVRAFDCFFRSALWPVAAVYNMGGGRTSCCSIIEAISICESLTGAEMKFDYEIARRGDHVWWITDTSKFEADFDWRVTYKTSTILKEIFEQNRESWSAAK